MFCLSVCYRCLAYLHLLPTKHSSQYEGGAQKQVQGRQGQLWGWGVCLRLEGGGARESIAIADEENEPEELLTFRGG